MPAIRLYHEGNTKPKASKQTPKKGKGTAKPTTTPTPRQRAAKGTPTPTKKAKKSGKKSDSGDEAQDSETTPPPTKKAKKSGKKSDSGDEAQDSETSSSDEESSDDDDKDSKTSNSDNDGGSGGDDGGDDDDDGDGKGKAAQHARNIPWPTVPVDYDSADDFSGQEDFGEENEEQFATGQPLLICSASDFSFGFC